MLLLHFGYWVRKAAGKQLKDASEGCHFGEDLEVKYDEMQLTEPSSQTSWSVPHRFLWVHQEMDDYPLS